jgi:hypothetical protein
VANVRHADVVPLPGDAFPAENVVREFDAGLGVVVRARVYETAGNRTDRPPRRTAGTGRTGHPPGPSSGSEQDLSPDDA